MDKVDNSTETVEQPSSLRDQLTAAFDKAEAPIEPTDKKVEKIQEPKGDKVRDEKGKFVAQENKEVVQEAPKPIKRPSSWKKDYWEKYDTLDEDLRNYILQREDEAARGISNYKAEAEKAKGIWDAIAPFQPELEKYGIQPQDHIQKLFNAHRTLALASPQEKLQMFAQLAQDYQVPLQTLLGQPQQQGDPRVDMLMNKLNSIESQRQQQEQQALAMQQAEVNNEIEGFAANTEQYPHFEQVRLKMAGLLQAGEADDLKSAYEKAVRLDDTLFDQIMEAKHAEKVRAEKESRDAAAKAAKGKAVQVRSSSPSPSVNANPKGLRAQLEAAFEEHGEGRI